MCKFLLFHVFTTFLINIQFSLTPFGASAGYSLSWDLGNYAKTNLSDGSNKIKPSGSDPWDSNKGIDSFWGYHNQDVSDIGSNTSPLTTANKNLYFSEKIVLCIFLISV